MKMCSHNKIKYYLSFKSLTIQRKMAENLAIAKTQEEAVSFLGFTVSLRSSRVEWGGGGVVIFVLLVDCCLSEIWSIIVVMSI